MLISFIFYDMFGIVLGYLFGFAWDWLGFGWDLFGFGQGLVLSYVMNWMCYILDGSCLDLCGFDWTR